MTRYLSLKTFTAPQESSSLRGRHTKYKCLLSSEGRSNLKFKFFVLRLMNTALLNTTLYDSFFIFANTWAKKLS